MADQSHRVTILIAVIGVIGTITAALIGNWDKIVSPPVKMDVGQPGPSKPEPPLRHSPISAAYGAIRCLVRCRKSRSAGIPSLLQHRVWLVAVVFSRLVAGLFEGPLSTAPIDPAILREAAQEPCRRMECR